MLTTSAAIDDHLVPSATVIDQSTLLNLVQIVEDAGRQAMDVYTGTIRVVEKDDRSPVTEADLRVHHQLMDRLPRLRDLPVVSEESADEVREVSGDFWLVDPLDGTKEFIKKTGEFTVNVALISNGRPVVGVVHGPAIDRTWYGAANVGSFHKAGGGDLMTNSPRIPAASPVRVAVSRDHVSEKDREFLLALEKVETIPMGSSLKFCRVASGEADLYVRFGRTMEWDTAAAQCVVECAGGHVVDVSGAPLRYGKRDRGNPSFLCFADPELRFVTGIAAKVGAR